MNSTGERTPFVPEELAARELRNNSRTVQNNEFAFLYARIKGMYQTWYELLRGAAVAENQDGGVSKMGKLDNSP